MAGPIAGALLSVLTKSGAGILADIVRERSPGAAIVIERVANQLGVEPTPEAIVARFEEDPGPIAGTIRAVEEIDRPTWDAFAGQAALLEREDARESRFSWAWRPAMCWLLLFLWLWNGVLLPIVNAIAKAGLATMPWDQLLAFSGLWLAIYGGGNTIKSVMGARATKVS